MQNELLKKLDEVYYLANASKLRRLLAKPYNYIHAIMFRELGYRFSRRELRTKVNTFFGANMHILLPSSTDIYLTGGKSHISEIRLARFLITHLAPGDNFVDVGAHYGYFSLLASKLVGSEGNVYSFEASPVTFQILQDNANMADNIKPFNKAVSDSAKHITFYQFPNLYSEYNTMYNEQFESQDWYKGNKPQELKIEANTIDFFAEREAVIPNIVKIDVEGAEYDVVAGMTSLLTDHAPILVLEFLSKSRSNSQHIKAEELLKKYGYQSYCINADGTLQLVEDVSHYFDTVDFNSDNIVFAKSKP